MVHYGLGGGSEDPTLSLKPERPKAAPSPQPVGRLHRKFLAGPWTPEPTLSQPSNWAWPHLKTSQWPEGPDSRDGTSLAYGRPGFNP